MSIPAKQLPKRHSDKHRFWQNHVRQQANGKLTQRRYCERHGLGYASFVRWRGLLSARQKPPVSTDSVSAFVPVHVGIPSEASNEAASHDTNTLELIMPNGTRIEGITSTNLDLAVALASRL